MDGFNKNLIVAVISATCGCHQVTHWYISEDVRHRKASTTATRHLLTNSVINYSTSMIELEALLELAIRRIP